MASPRPVDPVIRICAVFSQDEAMMQQAIEELQLRWGPAPVRSSTYPFDAGGYYRSAMGSGLRKCLVGFTDAAPPEDLAAWKQETNDLEDHFANSVPQQGDDATPARPLNLDPGYVTQAKLVLATTKDRDHRIYLHSGIFAEVTLSYTGGEWQHHRWTYPDYRTEPVTGFVEQCRLHLRSHLRERGIQRQA